MQGRRRFWSRSVWVHTRWLQKQVGRGSGEPAASRSRFRLHFYGLAHPFSPSRVRLRKHGSPKGRAVLRLPSPTGSPVLSFLTFCKRVTQEGYLNAALRVPNNVLFLKDHLDLIKSPHKCGVFRPHNGATLNNLS